MKYLSIVLMMALAMLFTACSSSKKLEPASEIYDFNVDKNATLISDIKNKVSPFRVKSYKMAVPEIMRLNWSEVGPTADIKHTDIIFKDIDTKGKIISVEAIIAEGVMPRHRKAELVVPTIQMIINELHNRGYKYFQIIEPRSVSNLYGFPINNVADFSTFLVPELSNPDDDAELENEEKLHYIFRDLERDTSTGRIKLVVYVNNNPKPNQIVWDIKKNLNK